MQTKAMSDGIIGLQAWFETPPGRYVQSWEQAVLDRVVADLFGYHALQLGSLAIQGLRCNRMPHRWYADSQTTDIGDIRPALVTDFAALPFPAASLDLVLLPHSLECGADPHTTLREVERVLVPEGRVVICGLNPASLWGFGQRRREWMQRLGGGQARVPTGGEWIGYWRLRDWLRLLGFEVESGQFACYRPAFRSEAWLARTAWMDAAGDRWWPIFGAVYFLVAVKRVPGVRPLSPRWKPRGVLASQPVPLSNRAGLE